MELQLILCLTFFSGHLTIFSEFSIICLLIQVDFIVISNHLWIVKMLFFLVLLHICFYCLIALSRTVLSASEIWTISGYWALEVQPVLLQKWMLMLMLFHNLNLNLKTEAMWKFSPLHNLNAGLRFTLLFYVKYSTLVHTYF